MENTSIKPGLLELLQQARADQRTWFSGLTEAERGAIGTLERWAAKDVAAHIGHWVQRAAEALVCAARNEEPPHYDDYLRVNDEVFMEMHDRPWTEIWANVDRAYADLSAQVQSIDEAALADPRHFAWRNDQALSGLVVGNGYSHPLAHLAQFYFDRGEAAHANQLQEKMTARLLELPGLRDAARYNLACYYATTGQRDRALTELRESLRLNPKLIEWSKQDTDLDSLRDDPAYQELYP